MRSLPALSPSGPAGRALLSLLPALASPPPPTGRRAWGAAEGGGATTPALRARPTPQRPQPASGSSPAAARRAREGGPPGVTRLPTSTAPWWGASEPGTDARRVVSAAQLGERLLCSATLPNVWSSLSRSDAVRSGGVPFHFTERGGPARRHVTYPGPQCC